MKQDTFVTMLRDGNALADILQSVPEDKRMLMRAMAGAYIDGMIAQEQLAAQAEHSSA